MSAHTPGPWRYEEGTKTIRAVPSNYWLATMDSWDGAVDHEANARLMAAAPALLEALEALEWKAGNVVASLEAVGKSCEGLKRAAEQARAAIAAAKGEKA